MLALVVLMVLLEYRRRKPEGAPAISTATKAEARKQEWTSQRERRWAVTVCVTAFIFIFMVTAEFIYAQGVKISPAAELQPDTSGRVVVSTATLAQGDLTRYSVNVNGTPVRFLLYRKPDGKVASVFDACQICGGIGFYKGSSGLICKNCAAPVNPQSVGQAGGCNPLPLEATQNGDSVVISVNDLAKQAGQFSK
jgi:uncharacterized membrane protein